MTIKNASSENRYYLQFSNYSSLNDSILSAQVPEFSFPYTSSSYSGEIFKVPGDNITIGDMEITFKLDEDWENFLVIYKWMRDNNFVYANVKEEFIFDSVDYMILSPTYKPLFSFKMGNVFPVAISSIEHTSMSEEAKELEFTVTFAINTIDLKESI